MRNVSKALRFPLSGLARNLSYRETTYPSEERNYGTPMAVNVIGSCSFSDRTRGGSRPPLVRLGGGQPEQATTIKWQWPNGVEILWPDGRNILQAVNAPAVLPGGSAVVDQHASFEVRASKGNVPQVASAFAVYRDRFFVASGSMWYASRTGDHGDFDYGGDSGDVTRAMAGTVALSGKEGEAITAIAAFGDSRLYVATKRMLAAISDEPTTGMSIVSENVGVVSRDAWCNADGVFYFVGTNGVYAFSDGAPILVSQSIPEELKGLSSAVMVFDPERSGIHIFTQTSDWFYDIAEKAFWPIEYESGIRPVSGGTAEVDGVNSVVFLCEDGVWRKWGEDGRPGEDDDEDVDSKVAIGPFKCSSGDSSDGMLDKITATLAEGSEEVTVSVFMGHSAEESCSRATAGTSPDFSFTASSGWNNVQRARCRGAWSTIVLSASGRWAYESILAEAKLLGGLRNG